MVYLLSFVSLLFVYVIAIMELGTSLQ